MMHTDIIMLVIASRSDTYDKLINTYWSRFINYIKTNQLTTIKIFLIFGNNVETRDLKLNDDDKLILNVPETYIPGILDKTIEAFKKINDSYTYKHIIRTNLSSFYILDNVIKISNELENTNVYAGIIGDYHGLKFISGAGIWLSRDKVQYIIDNRSSLDRTLIDDVSIGKLLINHKKRFINRYDLTDGREILDKIILFNNIINHKYCHIRIKSNNNNLDLNYMDKFSQIMYTK